VAVLVLVDAVAVVDAVFVFVFVLFWCNDLGTPNTTLDVEITPRPELKLWILLEKVGTSKAEDLVINSKRNTPTDSPIMVWCLVSPFVLIRFLGDVQA
jgi:hypothetical protein